MDDDVLSGFPDFEADVEVDSAAAGAESPEAAVDAGLDSEVREFFTAFVKTVRAAQLYVQGNPLLHQFVNDLTGRLDQLWDRIPNLNFTIHESEIRWLNTPVYKEKLGAQDNIAFQLYRDGIRRLELQPGVEDDEIRQFIDVLRLGKTLKEEEDDLLTLMWNCDFQHIRYEYVDVLGDEPPVPTPDLEDEAGTELPALPELELSPELQTQTLREDFEPSLYFLDETEVAHLQQELLREWERSVKRDVVSSILDQYEGGDEERRSEIMAILRQMLPRVLAEGNFGDAAYVVKELQSISAKRQKPDIDEQVEQVIAELSQPIVLEQLVRILEDGSVDPNSEDLATLLGALKPEAIASLMQAIPHVARRGAREQLLATLDRLASKNPGLMAAMIKSEDPRVAAEAAKIAGRLKMAGTAEAIASLLRREEPEVRLAGVQALVEMRTSMAGAPLLKALGDNQRDVRVAAARGLAALRFSPGTDELEAYIKGKELQKRDLTEQLAFFEAYAEAAGPRAVKLLSKLLNGRRVLWMKHPSSVRACAARALGIIGGRDADAELDLAELDKDPMVLSAVHKARMPAEDKKPVEQPDAGS
jgi:HEAT repeat protein